MELYRISWGRVKYYNEGFLLTEREIKEMAAECGCRAVRFGGRVLVFRYFKPVASARLFSAFLQGRAA